MGALGTSNTLRERPFRRRLVTQTPYFLEAALGGGEAAHLFHSEDSIVDFHPMAGRLILKQSREGDSGPLGDGGGL